MLVIIAEPGKAARSLQINEQSALKELQRLVDGYIEVVSCDYVELFKQYTECQPLQERLPISTVLTNIDMVINEEGKFIGLKRNFPIKHDVIVGTAVFVAIKECEHIGLSPIQAKHVATAIDMIRGLEREEVNR